MDKKDLDQLIDKSILGKLKQDERLKLDAYIMEHPEIKHEIKMRTDILKGLEYNADQELKSVLNEIHKEVISGPKKYSVFKKVAIIGLCVAFILGAFFLYQYFNSATNSLPSQNSGVYASYFKPYEPSVETRSTENINDEQYQTFIDAYRAKDYRKSLETIQPLLDGADNNTLLLAGISAMQTENHQESIQYLNRIIESNDFYFMDHAKWYKALAFIKTNKIEEAKKLLQELANDRKADHHSESVALLKEI